MAIFYDFRAPSITLTISMDPFETFQATPPRTLAIPLFKLIYPFETFPGYPLKSISDSLIQTYLIEAFPGWALPGPYFKIWGPPQEH
jgi:hypothetical protein